MVNDKLTRKIVFYAVMLALIFSAMMLDKAISFIPGISFAAAVLLMTLSFCFLDNTWLTATLSGVMFGVASFLKEFIFPSLSLSVFPVYEFAIITIVPRCFVGVFAFGAYRLCLKIIKIEKERTKQTVALTVGVLVGLVTNTMLYLSALTIFRNIHAIENDGVFAVIYAVLLTNVLPEYLISLVAAPQVVLGVRRGLKMGLDGNNNKRQVGEEK